jgi:hypothetical protein
MHRGRAVLAMDCVLAGAEWQHSRPLNSVVRCHMTPSPELIERGLNRIRQLRRQLWLTFLLGFAVVVVLGGITRSEIVAGIAFGIYALVMIVVGFRLMLVPCPQCRCEFHLTTIEKFPRKCGNCGLSLDQSGRKFFW